MLLYFELICLSIFCYFAFISVESSYYVNIHETHLKATKTTFTKYTRKGPVELEIQVLSNNLLEFKECLAIGLRISNIK